MTRRSDWKRWGSVVTYWYGNTCPSMTEAGQVAVRAGLHWVAVAWSANNPRECRWAVGLTWRAARRRALRRLQEGC